MLLIRQTNRKNERLIKNIYKMKIEVETNGEKILSELKSEKTTLSNSELIKKPKSIRRKLTKSTENSREVKKFLWGQNLLMM